MADKSPKSRFQNFKNNGKDEDEMRCRRNEALVEQRKDKREESLLKRRTVGNEDDDDNSIVQSSLEMIIQKVKSDEPNEQISGVREVGKLVSSSDRNYVVNELLNNGILPILINCLNRDDNPTLQNVTARVLTNIASGTTAEVQGSLLKRGDNSTSPLNMEGTVPKGKISKPVDDREVTNSKLTSKNRNPIIGGLISSGILPVLVKCLKRDDNPTLQFVAACVLINLSAGTSAQVQQVVNSGVAPLLLELLKSPHQKVCQQALNVLSNIINDSLLQRDYVTQLGVVTRLLDIINPDGPLELLRSITSVIVQLCRNKELHPETIMVLMPTLCQLINHTDHEVLVDTLGTFYFFANGGINHIQLVIDSGALARIVTLLSDEKFDVKESALHAVGSIVTGTVGQIQAVLDCHALDQFPALLHHPNTRIKKKAVWILSNITRGNQQQIQAVINARLIPMVIHHLREGEFRLSVKAAWALSNLILVGTKAQVEYLASLESQKWVAPLCSILSARNPQVLHATLVALNNILKTTGTQFITISS